MEHVNLLEEITNALTTGGITIVRTDTLYGIIALASDEQAVEKVYAAKHRSLDKACIVLLATASQAPAYAEVIEKVTNESDQPTSIVIPATIEPSWIRRSGDSVAYRVVRDEFLKKVIEEVGPVIAPSANPEGFRPASTIQEAKYYFGDKVDAYIDGGQVPKDVAASSVIEILDDGTIRKYR